MLLQSFKPWYYPGFKITVAFHLLIWTCFMPLEQECCIFGIRLLSKDAGNGLGFVWGVFYKNYHTACT